MITTTINLTIFGNSHTELLDNADAAIEEYVGKWFDESGRNSDVNYEMIVYTNQIVGDEEPAQRYRAEVLARFKDD